MERQSQKDKFITFGNNHRGVFRHLMERKGGVKNTERQKKIKLGLIIDGGGMRSIISGGTLVALHELGFSAAFDRIYGSSAGALAGAYFLSGQSPYGISIFYENLSGNKFINYKRGLPFFDIDYLMHVVEHKKSLDTESIKKSDTELVMCASEIGTGELRFFSSKEDIPLMSAIKASCALPLYYDKPVEIEGKKYMDAATAGLTPVVRKAIADGCTDVLILLNKQKHRRDREYSKSPFWFNLWRLKWYLTHLKKAPLDNRYKQSRFLSLVEGGDPMSAHVNIAVIAPVKLPFHIATRDAKKLREAYHASYGYSLNLFTHLPYDDSAVHLQKYSPLLQPYGISC